MRRPEEVLQEREAARAQADTVPAFPLDALPGPCARMARELAAAVPCPPDFAAVPMLAVASAAIGARRSLGLKAGHEEAARLYLATCGPPGSGKSPGFRAALGPAWDWQADARAAHLAEHAAWERAMAEHEVAAERWKAARRKGVGGEPPSPPTEPALARLVAEDVTVEALAPLLDANPRGVILACDELAGWVNGIGQYKQGRGADRQRWLSLWTGSPLAIDRKGGAAIMVPRPFVVVTGGLQPDALGVLVDDHGADDGFADRVLVSYPDPVPITVSDAGVSDAARQGWAEVFRALRGPMPTPEGEPATLALDDEAAAGWRAWRERLYAAREEAPPHLAGPLAKLESHAGRLALVAHELRRAAGEGGRSDRLDGESLRRGLALADYFRGHFERVYARVEDARATLGRRRGARGPAPERRAELGERAMTELRRAGIPLTLSAVASAVGADPKARALRGALAELVQAGMMRREGFEYFLPQVENRTPGHHRTPRMNTEVSGSVPVSSSYGAGPNGSPPGPPTGAHHGEADSGEPPDASVENAPQPATHENPLLMRGGRGGELWQVPRDTSQNGAAEGGRHGESGSGEPPEWRDEVPEGIDPEHPFAEPHASNGPNAREPDNPDNPENPRDHPGWAAPALSGEQGTPPEAEGAAEDGTDRSPSATRGRS